MHFFTTDMMVAALAFIALYIFFYDTVEIRRVVLSSIFAGALLATKFTGILMFLIMFSFIFSSRNKEHFFVSYLIFTLLSCAFFLIFNPHSWFGILDEVLFYFASAVSRDTVVPISTVYFGKVYNYVLPWHHPFVMFGITLPIPIPIFLVPGLIWNLRRIKERTSFFESVPLIVLFAFFVLPKVPKHDGIRLFSMAWPFIVILFIRGTFVFSRCLKTPLNVLCASASRGTQHFSSLAVVTMIILIVSNIFLSSRDIYHYHPHELSYFNKFIGGPKGALQKGFTISYWFEALNEDALGKINNLFKHEETKICSYPHYQILNWNNYFGFLDDNIHSASNLEEADYFLFLNRMIPWRIYSELKKNTEYQIAKLEDGTLILGLKSVDTR
jgi:hypothetical protein